MYYSSEYGNIYYEVHGPQDSPVLLFTHGIFMDHITFKDQLAYFSKDYRVILWDMPGHGRSVINDDDFNFSMVSECLIGILDELNVSSAVLIGLSLGGLISQHTAYHYADRVSAVVIIGANPLHCDRKLHGKIRSRVAWKMVLGVSTLMPGYVLAQVSSKGKAIKKKTMKYIIETASKAGKKKILAFTRISLADILEGIENPIQQPLLITHGVKEVKYNVRHARKWHNEIKGSKYAVISDAGHIANQDNPQGFNIALQKFLIDADIHPNFSGYLTEIQTFKETPPLYQVDTVLKD